MLTAAYTGTFDPITLGHADLIARAAQMFPRVVVAVARSAAKNTLFTLEERVELARASLAELDNVQVEGFDGLTVDFARDHGVSVLVRGVRNITDFDYESQMARMIRHLSPQLDTVILPPSAPFAHISSTLVREIATMGGPVDDLVPQPVVEAVRKRQEQR